MPPIFLYHLQHQHVVHLSILISYILQTYQLHYAIILTQIGSVITTAVYPQQYRPCMKLSIKELNIFLRCRGWKQQHLLSLVTARPSLTQLILERCVNYCES